MTTIAPVTGKPHFLEDLDALRQALIELGALVESRVADAMRGLVEHDIETLHEVALADGDVNERQMAIDDRAFKLLALHQPVAVDLRFIVAAIKINADLERVGDLAVNIAEAARRCLAANQSPDLFLLPRMSEIAQTMLKESLASFVSGALGVAQAVLERDDALDSLREQVYTRYVDVMRADSSAVPASLELMLIGRHLERIGDHATNIAEDVFFVIAGADVRHNAVGWGSGSKES